MTSDNRPIDFDGIEVLTFDCYGTLIDWESGIAGALRPVLEAHGTPLEDEQILELYAGIEADLEGNRSFRDYTTVLQEVVDEIGAGLGWVPTEVERSVLSSSLPGWPPFSDTVDALRILKDRFRLAVISNVDDELFAGTSKLLGTPFDLVITAQQVGAYKPDLKVFERALEIVALPREAVLHVAQSLYHDIAPAIASGLKTVWVNRRGRREGGGATPPASARPHLEVPDLKTLVSHMVQT